MVWEHGNQKTDTSIYSNIILYSSANIERNCWFQNRLTNAIYNMDSAYQKFFRGHAGYPKFKSKHDNHKSYTTNFTNGNITVDFEKGK